ncbi:MAG: ATP-binding protein [Thermoprotei archaeon]|nr:MAG: ATP-binding protein [Thermofilum sp. ex4484_79]RLE59961.1 MAG: ATP-binding protein [Thermoprotei archaeon]HDD64424.1 ATP-binding protein [Thermoprotei archaeon]
MSEAKKKVKIIKRDGTEEEFIKEKVVVSCYNSGAPIDVAREIADEVEKKVKDGMTTDDIRNIVLEELHKRNPEWSNNYAYYDALIKGRVTYENGKFVVVPKGTVYLGREVKDVGEKGLSEVSEVQAILDQLKEDLEHGISRATIHRRTRILFLAVLRTRKMSKEDKLKSIELINEFRKSLGWKPFKLKKIPE